MDPLGQYAPKRIKTRQNRTLIGYGLITPVFPNGSLLGGGVPMASCAGPVDGRGAIASGRCDAPPDPLQARDGHPERKKNSAPQTGEGRSRVN
jgi:hypothetical protein